MNDQQSTPGAQFAEIIADFEDHVSKIDPSKMLPCAGASYRQMGEFDLECLKVLTQVPGTFKDERVETDGGITESRALNLEMPVVTDTVLGIFNAKTDDEKAVILRMMVMVYASDHMRRINNMTKKKASLAALKAALLADPMQLMEMLAALKEG